MKRKEKNFIDSKVESTYVAPRVKVEQIEMEQGIAVGSGTSIREEYEQGDDDDRTFIL